MILNMTNAGYDIVIERGVINKAGELLNLNRRVVVVTDSGVPKEYASCVANQCKEASVYTFPQGEASKNMDTFQSILKAMLKANLDRSDCVVAVGGGVVGDMTGFAAACYMRGIDFYNIPTTLLSQVDSSIGGKTAIDFEGVKNIVGAFYMPKKVLVDPDLLNSLDARLVHEGLAESIKMAATFDEELFDFIANTSDLMKDVDHIIEKSLSIKKMVVEEDPYEKGLRRVLNFGHTIGHGIESFNEGKLLHGECVALGMTILGLGEAKERIVDVLKKYDLPYEIKDTADDIVPIVMHDKKAKGKIVNVVCVEKIGSYEIKPMTEEEIRGLWA